MISAFGLPQRFAAPRALASLDALAQAVLEAPPHRRMHAALAFEARLACSWLDPTVKTMIVRQLVTDLSRRIRRDDPQVAEDRYVIPHVLRTAQRDLGRAIRTGPIEFIAVDFSHLAMRRLRFAEIHFVDCRFDHANLENSSLNNSVFLGCSFVGAALAGASMQRADFSAGSFAGGNFFEADARGALFLRAELDDSDFSFANLSGANLSGASLGGVHFHGANLAGALFEGVENFDPSALREAARPP
jgi:hypothetical protein